MADNYMTLADMIDAGKLSDMAAMFAQRFREQSDVLNMMGFSNAPTGNYSWTEELTLPTSEWVGISGTDPDASKGTFQPHITSTSMMRGSIIADNVIERRATAQGSTTGTIARQARGLAKANTYLCELALFDGEPTTSAAQPQGLNSMLTLTSGADKNLYYADNAGSAGASLTMDMLEDLVDAVRDGANALLMSQPMRREVKKLYRDQTQLIYSDEAAFTNKVMLFEGIPILIIGRGRARSEILGFDETVGSDADCGSIYAVKFDQDGFFGIQDTPMEVMDPVPVGPYKKEYGFQWTPSFVAFRPNVAARLAGIQAA